MPVDPKAKAAAEASRIMGEHMDTHNKTMSPEKQLATEREMAEMIEEVIRQNPGS